MIYQEKENIKALDDTYFLTLKIISPLLIRNK
nr:MAG TPA: hypothetical protein [Crassvirales sp.]